MLHRLMPANATLADRFGFFLFWLFEGMALDWRRRGLRHVHNAEINQRILGLWKRLRSVLEQWRAGKLRAVRGRAADAASEGTPTLGSRVKPGDAGKASLPLKGGGNLFGQRAPDGGACCRGGLGG